MKSLYPPFPIVCFVIAVLAFQDVQSVGMKETLEEFVEDQVTNGYLPVAKSTGFGVAIVSGVMDGGSQILYNRGFGMSNLEYNSAATNRSLFCIASVTKSFTAALVVKILSEKFPQFGPSVLDIPVIKLVTDGSINVTLSDRYRSETVSFRDLLSHRTCVNSHHMGAECGAVKSFEDYVYRTRYEVEVCPFRGGYLYSNAMFSLAGDLIAKISGDTFTNLMEGFLTEIGMTNSKWINMDEDYENLENMAQGYYINKEGVLTRANANLLRQVSNVAPAAAILSTAEDMMKYISFHLSGGRNLEGQQIISKDMMQWLGYPSIHIDKFVAYGLGLQIIYGVGPDTILAHSGSWPPYASLLTLYPALNTGIFTTSNGPGLAVPQDAQLQLHLSIFDFIAQQQNLTKVEDQFDVGKQNLKFSTLFPKESKQQMKYKTDDLNSKESNSIKIACADSDIIGRFGSGENGEIEIFIEASTQSLKIQFGTLATGNLHQVEEEDCKFVIEWTSDIVVMFQTSLDGSVNTHTLDFKLAEVSGEWDTAILQMDAEITILQRNLTLEDLPIIPYDPSSCAPSSHLTQVNNFL